MGELRTENQEPRTRRRDQGTQTHEPRQSRNQTPSARQSRNHPINHQAQRTRHRAPGTRQSSTRKSKAYYQEPDNHAIKNHAPIPRQSRNHAITQSKAKPQTITQSPNHPITIYSSCLISLSRTVFCTPNLIVFCPSLESLPVCCRC